MPSDIPNPPQASSPQVPNAYADLLRDTRGLRREQQQAREAWFARLAEVRKEETLFELEILLKGIACFANPKNHPGGASPRAVVSHDFREHLGHARDGMARVVQLARSLLGDRDRAFAFQRYLETVLPEDTSRTKLLSAAMAQESPEESLFMLRHGFTNLLEVGSGLLRLPRLTFRLFHAHLGTAMREIAQSAFFNPLSALEFRPEFDRIASPAVLDVMKAVPSDQALRLVALSFLSLFRMLRYLRLLDVIALDHASRRAAGRAYLVLSVLRSDARALSNYLRRRAGGLLADGYERDLLRVPAGELAAQSDELFTEGRRLVTTKAGLLAVAATLRLEMRRTFEHDLPRVDAATPDQEFRSKIRAVTSNLRPALQGAVLSLGRALGARLDPRESFEDEAALRVASERLRRDAWMFAQIARAFAIKARHTDLSNPSWSKPPSFAFVREFLAYFRAFGYPLVRSSDYPRAPALLAAMRDLGDLERLDAPRLAEGARECEALFRFLSQFFEQVSAREEIASAPFDRPSAARALRLYLGN